MRVLVVEDDPLMRELLREVLVQRGHEPVACLDAETGWEAWRREPFALVVLDWVLPGADGLELCRRLRAEPAGERAVILVATGRDKAEDLAQVLEAGADDYVAKPTAMEHLDVRLAIAEQLVASKAARARAEEAAHEAARLEGALLAAATLEHHLGNQLARTLGYSEMLADDARLPDDLKWLAREAMQGVVEARASVDKLRGITRLEEDAELSGPPVLDLERSAGDD